MKAVMIAIGTAVSALLWSGCSISSTTDSADVLSDLSDAQKYTLAYMWNEEKLAKDIYLALDDAQGVDVLYTIATRSETQHQAAVEALVALYDINITNLDDYAQHYSEAELRALAPGEYAIPALQTLYDTLYAEGSASYQEALQTGCKVEVNDINDLTAYIAVAAGADDLVSTFESLRSESYNHYNAISAALQDLGVTEGCCILGDDYCIAP